MRSKTSFRLAFRSVSDQFQNGFQISFRSVSDQICFSGPQKIRVPTPQACKSERSELQSGVEGRSPRENLAILTEL